VRFSLYDIRSALAFMPLLFSRSQLRRDIHSLFDRGYVTVTPELRFEVSGRIKEEFDNGQDYYALHGRSVDVPSDLAWQPDRQAGYYPQHDRDRDGIACEPRPRR
jgi:hypothetical protein